MKIAVDCRMLGKSGIGIFTKNLLENLPPEHEYLLIGNTARLQQYARAENILACNSAIFSLQEMFAYPAAAVNKCAAYFTPNWNIPLGLKIPVYSMIHDVVFLDLPETISTAGRLIRRGLLWRAVKISRHIFTVSEFSRQRIISHFPNAQEKISIVYSDVSAEIKKFTQIHEKQPQNYYLYVGNIKKHKGLTTLISAYKKLNTSAKLYIVGDKENFRAKDKRFANFAAKNVIFTGQISDQELYKLLHNAKALIQPSLYEGFGLPPLEALWLKTPVILSDIPVFKEIYAGLPVTFFKTSDSADLAEKMRNIRPDVEYAPEKILKKYAAAQIASVIFAAIQLSAGRLKK
jgi:glycosyltransferase involved in cell wall biosynthesis